MKTLVTGGAGFIGSHIVDALVGAGHDVCVVDNLSRGRRALVNPAAEFVQVDITDSGFADVVSEVRPEVVFHQAAQTDVRRSVADPLEDSDVNVLGTVNVLHACAEHGTRRVVFASSGGAIYGDANEIPTPESYPPRPASPYGTSKLCAEAYGGTYARMRGLEFAALRYANVYGPRQDPHGEAGVVAIFAMRLLRGEQATINGDGTQTRDYVFVNDVVSANLRAATAESPGAFNIGTGVETDVNGIFERVRAITGGAGDALHGPAKKGEQQRSCLAVERARTALDWEPRTNLDEGLRRTVDFFRHA